MGRVRFARGAAWKSPWCAVEHRDIEWAPRSSREEFELVIMIAVAIEEMLGSDRVLTCEDYKASRGWLALVFSTRAKWRFPLSGMPNYALDNADIVREAISRR